MIATGQNVERVRTIVAELVVNGSAFGEFRTGQ